MRVTDRRTDWYYNRAVPYAERGVRQPIKIERYRAGPAKRLMCRVCHTLDRWSGAEPWGM